eukprot:1345714-Rhodomonas_salina.2
MVSRWRKARGWCLDPSILAQTHTGDGQHRRQLSSAWTRASLACIVHALLLLFGFFAGSAE